MVSYVFYAQLIEAIVIGSTFFKYSHIDNADTSTERIHTLAYDLHINNVVHDVTKYIPGITFYLITFSEFRLMLISIKQTNLKLFPCSLHLCVCATRMCTLT